VDYKRIRDGFSFSANLVVSQPHRISAAIRTNLWEFTIRIVSGISCSVKDRMPVIYWQRRIEQHSVFSIDSIDSTYKTVPMVESSGFKIEVRRTG